MPILPLYEVPIMPLDEVPKLNNKLKYKKSRDKFWERRKKNA